MVCTKVDKVARIEGGFVLLPVAELMHAWHVARTDPLGIADFRAWLACREMVARRCHVHRDRDRSPSFGYPELAKLLDTTERRARASIRRLEAAGLLAWAADAIVFPAPQGRDKAEPATPAAGDTIGRGRGSIAIPRRMLRHFVAGGRSALIATVLGVLLRCLSCRKAGWSGRGRVKASWIAHTFGFSDRQAKAARAELVAMGWIAPEDSDQTSMNRWGRTYLIDLGWQAPARDDRRVIVAGDNLPITRGGRESSLPTGEDRPEFVTPSVDQEPLRGGIRNQEPRPEPAGVETKGKGKGGRAVDTILAPAGTRLASNQPPQLDDVRVEDLEDAGRLLQLHDQAIAEGLVTTAEADRLRVVASAEHALAVGKSNPAGLFAYLIRNRAWRYLTGDDEDRANARIKAHLRGPEPSRALFVASSSKPIEPGLSEDARVVREIRAACIRAGIFRDPWPTFAARNPAWTRGRWDAALAALGLA